MKSFILFLNFLLIYTLSSADYEIRGKVMDASENKPIPDATVRFLSLPDSSLVDGVYTESQKDNLGHFSKKLPEGRYFLEVSFIGFDKFQSAEFNLNKDLDFGINKNFMGNKLIVTISGDDIFNTRMRRIITEGETFRFDQDMNWRSGQVLLSVTYNFKRAAADPNKDFDD